MFWLAHEKKPKLRLHVFVTRNLKKRNNRKMVNFAEKDLE